MVEDSLRCLPNFRPTAQISEARPRIFGGLLLRRLVDEEESKTALEER